MAKVMRKEARHTQRRDRASGVPLEILEHLPHHQSLPTLLFCALTYTSDFTGGCPPPPLSEISAPSSSLSSEHPCIPAGLCLGGSSSHLVVPYAPLPGCSLLQAALLPSSTTASCRTVAILTVPASHQGPSGKWLGGNSTLS